MGVLQRIYEQFMDQFRSMSSSQRLTLVAVTLLVAGAFAAVMWNQQATGYTALSWGKVYSTEELIAAEQALIKANLREFRREGQRLLVPSKDVDRYNAALVEFDAMPADLGDQMMKQLSALGPFSTDKQREQLKEAMLLQELRRTIRAIPDVEDARVVVAGMGRRTGFSRAGRVTANVSVKLRSGHDVTPKMASSIRAAVSSMVPDLRPADVTVFDTRNATAHTEDPAGDPFDGKLIQRIRELKRDYQQQIQQNLSYIPNVVVAVNVDVENTKNSLIREQTIDKAKIAALYTNETNVKDAAIKRRPQGEPGVASNRPATVAATSAPEQTRDFTDQSTNSVNALSFRITEQELIAAMPRAVQATVSIPRDYYREILTRREAAGEKATLPEIEKEVLDAVRKSVLRLIPQESKEENIVVQSVDLLPQSTPDLSVPVTERIWEFLRTWSGSIALACFALWALATVRRSLPAAPAAPSESTGSSSGETLDVQRLRKASRLPEETEEDEATRPKEITQRDMIQNIVRDNPEMSATVIGKWLQTAK